MAGIELKNENWSENLFVPLGVPCLAPGTAQRRRSSGIDPSGWLDRGRVNRRPTKERLYHACTTTPTIGLNARCTTGPFDGSTTAHQAK